MIPILLFILGLVLLVAGAEFLVRGASRLAAAVGVSPLIIGLTIVAFGTSAPELAVGSGAALQDHTDVAIGNAIGSNAFNILFILGVSAIIVPLSVARQLIKIDLPVMILAALLAMLLSLDGSIGRVDGAVFVACMAGYTLMQIVLAKRERKVERDEFEAEYGAKDKPAPSRTFINIGLIVVGIAMLVGGSHWLVGGATIIARKLGISEHVIGVTLIACGTSLPEVFTSIMAAIKGERDIAVGNVVGSNIFNVFGVLGGAALCAPHGLPVSPQVLWIDMSVVLLTSLICVPIFITGKTISRIEGAIFLALYVGYLIYLFVYANGQDAI